MLISLPLHKLPTDVRATFRVHQSVDAVDEYIREYGMGADWSGLMEEYTAKLAQYPGRPQAVWCACWRSADDGRWHVAGLAGVFVPFAPCGQYQPRVLSVECADAQKDFVVKTMDKLIGKYARQLGRQFATN